MNKMEHFNTYNFIYDTFQCTFCWVFNYLNLDKNKIDDYYQWLCNDFYYSEYNVPTMKLEDCVKKYIAEKCIIPFLQGAYNDNTM